MQPLSGKVRVECQKTEGFLRFFLVGRTPLRESGCRVSKTEAIFFWSGAPLSGKTRVECQKLVVFCVFGGPESVLRIVLTIRFASYGRFFERGKMSENRQKTLKTVGFWRFFRVRSNPLLFFARRPIGQCNLVLLVHHR